MMNITNHAVERYAQRIMGMSNAKIENLKQEEIDLIRKVLEDDVNPDNLLYSGMPYVHVTGRDYESSNSITVPSDIYLADNIVIIYDSNTNAIITVYKIDLGFDDSLNARYIETMKSKIEMRKKIKEIDSANFDDIIHNYEVYIEEYKSSIAEAEDRIRKYKNIVAEYEASLERNKREKEEMQNKATKEIEKLVATMIQKK